MTVSFSATLYHSLQYCIIPFHECIILFKHCIIPCKHCIIFHQDYHSLQIFSRFSFHDCIFTTIILCNIVSFSATLYHFLSRLYHSLQTLYHFPALAWFHRAALHRDYRPSVNCRRHGNGRRVSTIERGLAFGNEIGLGPRALGERSPLPMFRPAMILCPSWTRVARYDAICGKQNLWPNYGELTNTVGSWWGYYVCNLYSKLWIIVEIKSSKELNCWTPTLSYISYTVNST